MIGLMNAAALPKWLLDHFRKWEAATGRKQTVSEFARWLGIKQPTVNRWMTGDSTPAGENLRRLAHKLGPEIYDVLGVPRPEDPSGLEDLPEALRERLEAALVETRDAYHKRKIGLDDPEAERIAIEIFERNGFKYIKTENED